MKSDQPASERLKVFAIQNLMLEADLVKLENSGIEIGHLQTLRKDEVVDTELFDHDILTQARKMADFYVLYYCLENSIRRLISERLKEKYEANWWDEKVPDGVKASVKEKQQKEKDSVFSIRSEDPLTYTNFGELIDIFNANWDDFSDTIRSKKAMQQSLVQFNQIRNVIAHSCELNDDEITRFELLIKDWLRIQM
ncbi:MAG: Swt1 family HEPN domain-containing protein [Bacteroidota bacterium]